MKKSIQKTSHLPLVHISFDTFEGVIDGERQNLVNKPRNIWMHGYHQPKTVLVHGCVDVALLFWELDFSLAKLVEHPWKMKIKM